MKTETTQHTQFCFTYAIDGGAWVIFPGDKRATWLSYAQIEKAKGKGWFERMRAKQGMFTGCWVNDGPVDNLAPDGKPLMNREPNRTTPHAENGWQHHYPK